MTARTLLTLVTFAALSGWVSGQTGSRRTADEEAELLKLNRPLLEALLDDGVKVADAETAIDRAAACRRAVDRLSAELAHAVRIENYDRASEIGEHLAALLSNGFLPPLDTARESIRPGSPDFDRLQTLHRESAALLNATVEGIPTRGNFGTITRVKVLREKLAKLTEQLGQPAE